MDSQPQPERFDPQRLYETWAPPESTWSAWAKPVLFANLAEIDGFSRLKSPVNDAEVRWLAKACAKQLALIVELPRSLSVYWGLAAARYGFRPVPLFNTSPGPAALLELGDIMTALRDGADALERCQLSPTAPPAFLLDSGRLAPKVPSSPGMYDNRWMVFPQDFPSGEFLQSQGIAGVILIQVGPEVIADDLREVLGRWAKSGLPLWHERIDAPGPARVIELSSWRPRRLWRYLAQLNLGLRYNSAGGFGGVIPQPRSSRVG